MKRLMAIALAVTGFAGPAVAMNNADCEALWKKADLNSDGVLSDAEASRYLAAMRVHKRQVPADNRLTPAAFTEACRADDFKAAANTDPQAPLKGSNSFTEGQAKDRALAAGLTDVSALKKDDDGIWRGTASDGGKTVNVAVDYKGNVVAR